MSEETPQAIFHLPWKERVTKTGRRHRIQKALVPSDLLEFMKSNLDRYYTYRFYPTYIVRVPKVPR
ncbi:MAG: hypothetical protein OK422_04430 [Thaumarchaeota archaeon]|nr:hypothetical protein [Nitrososphaerota archaeon]